MGLITLHKVIRNINVMSANIRRAERGRERAAVGNGNESTTLAETATAPSAVVADDRECFLYIHTRKRERGKEGEGEGGVECCFYNDDRLAVAISLAHALARSLRLPCDFFLGAVKCRYSMDGGIIRIESARERK